RGETVFFQTHPGIRAHFNQAQCACDLKLFTDFAGADAEMFLVMQFRNRGQPVARLVFTVDNVVEKFRFQINMGHWESFQQGYSSDEYDESDSYNRILSREA